MSQLAFDVPICCPKGITELNQSNVSFRQACMKRFCEFAIVSGFTFGEAGDGEMESARKSG
jgi:hypothetical protein